MDAPHLRVDDRHTLAAEHLPQVTIQCYQRGIFIHSDQSHIRRERRGQLNERRLRHSGEPAIEVGQNDDVRDQRQRWIPDLGTSVRDLTPEAARLQTYTTKRHRARAATCQDRPGRVPGTDRVPRG